MTEESLDRFGLVDDPDVRIVEYDQVDPDQVTILNQLCHWWILTKDGVEKIRKRDPWATSWYALYAVSGSEILSQVILMMVDTETVHGTEKVGFIAAVSTFPQHARQGLAHRLIGECQKRAGDMGARYCILGTSRALVAYNLYRRMGYIDLLDLHTGHKHSSPFQTWSDDVSYKKGRDVELVNQLFQEYSQGLLGFTHRRGDFIESRLMQSHSEDYDVGTFVRDGSPIGYAVTEKSQGVLWIYEVCCPDTSNMKDCILSLEREFGMDRMIYYWSSRKATFESVISAGYTPVEKTWGVYMINDLEGETDIHDFRQRYGFDDDRFQMSSLDVY